MLSPVKGIVRVSAAFFKKDLSFCFHFKARPHQRTLCSHASVAHLLINNPKRTHNQALKIRDKMMAKMDSHICVVCYRIRQSADITWYSSITPTDIIRWRFCLYFIESKLFTNYKHHCLLSGILFSSHKLFIRLLCYTVAIKTFHRENSSLLKV